MNEKDFGVEESAYNPASMSASSLLSWKAVWYKRPWFLLSVAIAVVIAVSVVTDLPHHISKSEDASAQNATLKQINTDITPCGYAVKEAFNFYDANVKGTLTKENLRQIAHLLVADQSVCSFTSGPIADLTTNIQVLDTAAGKHIDSMMIVIVKWTTDDALSAIDDIQYYFAHLGNVSKTHDLTKQELLLAKDRRLALADEAAASAELGTTLLPLQLPSLPQLLGT